MKPLALVPLVTTLASSILAASLADAKVVIPWDGVCPCEWRAPGVFWRDKAEFVRCAIDATRAALVAGEITPQEAKQSIRVARRFVPCGRRSFARKATCGGPTGRRCLGRGDLCSYEGPACAAGRWGYCVNRSCSPIGDTGPVCGCDGRTYDRYCLAIEAGVEVAHSGRCAAGPTGG